MKLLKKMSTFVVALTFLFVFSIKANAAESYKVGDKVLFGDFGGHLIENSDSNSNTVKVFVDGWNKTKEEWDEYWLAYNDGNILNSSDFKYGIKVIKEKIKNISEANMSFNDFEKVGINVKKFNDGTTDYYYIDDEIPEWLLSKNYNFLGTGNLKFNIKNAQQSDKVELRLYSGVKNQNDEQGFLFYPMTVKDIQDSYVEGGYRLNDNLNGVYRNLSNFKNVSYAFIQQRNSLFDGYGSEDVLIESVLYPYDIVTLDKSNLTKVVDKCDDYNDSYKITYETNGGDKIDTATVSGNKELTTPKRDGYIFDGWYTDSTFKNKVSSIIPTEKMNDTCLAGYNDVTVYAKWNKELKDEKVSIVADEKVLTNVKNIAVKVLDKITAHNIDVLKKFTAYDITLKDSDEKNVQPNGKVKLHLEIPEGYDKTKVGIFGLVGDTLEAYETTINGNYAEALVEHFSTYIVGEKAEAKQEEIKTTESKDDNSNIQNPKTGDNTIIYFVAGLLLISGLVIVSKKLRTVK